MLDSLKSYVPTCTCIQCTFIRHNPDFIPEGPSPPRFLEVRNPAPHIVEVRWTEPAEPNGIIISYTVYAVQQPDITLNEGSLTEPMDPIVKVSCVLNNHALRLFFHFINPRISSWSLYLFVCVFTASIASTQRLS